MTDKIVDNSIKTPPCLWELLHYTTWKLSIGHKLIKVAKIFMTHLMSVHALLVMKSTPCTVKQNLIIFYLMWFDTHKFWCTSYVPVCKGTVVTVCRVIMIVQTQPVICDQTCDVIHANPLIKIDRDSFSECYLQNGGCQTISSFSRLPDDMAFLFLTLSDQYLFKFEFLSGLKFTKFYYNHFLF